MRKLKKKGLKKPKKKINVNLAYPFKFMIQVMRSRLSNKRLIKK